MFRISNNWQGLQPAQQKILKDSLTPLLKAIKEQNNDVAEFLIKQGANVNEQVGIGHATSSVIQNLPISKQLLKNDLNINTN